MAALGKLGMEEGGGDFEPEQDLGVLRGAEPCQAGQQWGCTGIQARGCLRKREDERLL